MPELMIFAGCNGAGKTTAAKVFLPDLFKIVEFINADYIAAGISPFNHESAAIEAGRIFLERMDDLVLNNLSFAIETTLAGRTYIEKFKDMKTRGYKIILFYFYISDIEIALTRIKNRVLSGGHDIPEETVKRRYIKSLQNFNNIYKYIVDEWYIYDNDFGKAELIASSLNKNLTISNEELYNVITKY